MKDIRDFIDRQKDATLFLLLLIAAFMLGDMWGSHEVGAALDMTIEAQGQYLHVLEDLRECRVDSIRYSNFGQ